VQYRQSKSGAPPSRHSRTNVDSKIKKQMTDYQAIYGGSMGTSVN